LSILSVAFLPAYHYLYEARKIKLLNIVQIVNLALGLSALFLASMYFGLSGAIIVAIILRFLNNVVASVWVGVREGRE